MIDGDAATSAFDHQDLGTAASDWQASLADLDFVELPSDSQLIVLAAHPDDETLGAGAVIAGAAARGVDVVVIIATDGEASHPGSPTHTADRLAAIRRSEAAHAVTALAPSAELTFLGLPDGALAGHVDDVETALAAVLAARADRPIWLVSPWAGDRHPDHAACSAAARAVIDRFPHARHWEYPIWLWHWGVPASGSGAGSVAGSVAGSIAGDAPWPAMRRVALPDEGGSALASAMNSYASQTQALSPEPGDEPVLSARFLDHFRRAFDVLIDPSWRPAAAADYFEKLYVDSADPWDLEDRWYEKRKRSLVLDSLPRLHFKRAFEPGCAGGQLTVELARRCDELVAVDVAAAAVRLARDRCGSAPGVTVRSMQIPREWPAGRFDLVVLSEVAYYCTDLAWLARRVRDCIEPDGVLVLCHWRHPATDHPHTAEHAHAALRAGTGLHLAVSHVEADFLLEVLTVSPSSVAAEEGLLD